MQDFGTRLDGVPRERRGEGASCIAPSPPPCLEEAPRYPAERETDIVLRDGSTVHVRPIRPAARDALIGFFTALSSESRWFRFFSASTSVEPFVDKAIAGDYKTRLDLVATVGAS